MNRSLTPFELVDREEREHPSAAKLARLLSLASQIEAELIRAMRLDWLGNHSAALEAEFWFSPLVGGRGPGGVALRPDVLPHLRTRLVARKNEGELDAAWSTLSRCHRHQSPFAIIEEYTTYLALAADADATKFPLMELELGRAVKALEASPDPALGRWVARILPRLPERARSSDPAIALARLANARLGGMRVRGVPRELEAESHAPAVQTTVGARLVTAKDGVVSLELSPTWSPDSRRVNVPLTDPLVIDVGLPTETGWAWQREMLDPAGISSVLVPGGAPVRLRTLKGDEHLLRARIPYARPRVFVAADMGGMAEEAKDLGWMVLSHFPPPRAGSAIPPLDGVFTSIERHEAARHRADVPTYLVSPPGLARLLIPADVPAERSDTVFPGLDPAPQSLRAAMLALDRRRLAIWLALDEDQRKRYLQLGAVTHPGGTTFRVWAPNAHAVDVLLYPNSRESSPQSQRAETGVRRTPMQQEPEGHWYVDIPDIGPGARYAYWIESGNERFGRVDPRARSVVSPNEPLLETARPNEPMGEVHETAVASPSHRFDPPPLDELVMYQLHVATFNANPREVGTFKGVIAQLDHLHGLGVNALQLLPVMECPQPNSIGYNPSFPFAVRGAYGGPEGLKELIRQAHMRGIAVFVDVVYSHLGPENGLSHFDQHEPNIYFYDDVRGRSPWGPRLNYDRPEVQQFLRDNMFMWLEEYQADGARWSATDAIYGLGPQGGELPAGWQLMQAINREVASRYPTAHMIAEDGQMRSRSLTRDVALGGAGFRAQWDLRFAGDMRQSASAVDDDQRNLFSVRDAITGTPEGVPRGSRVIFTESFDDLQGQGGYLPQAINRAEPEGWFARRRSTLAAALTLTAPGVPLLFQGQEFLSVSSVHDPLDWGRRERFADILQLYRDLLVLRRDLSRTSAGLRGPHVNVFHLNAEDKVMAYHRWKDSGPGDDVIVVANLRNKPFRRYIIGMPRSGRWKVRFTSDDPRYGSDFEPTGFQETESHPAPLDGMPCSADVSIGRYGVVILSQDPTGSS